MADTINFEAKDKRVDEVIFSSTSKFKVPRYQRPYSWEEDQISEFWNDLITSNVPYLLGSVIFNFETFDTDGHIEIIDGQQRLLTITIFISVLRDISTKYDNSMAERFQRHCIAFEDRRGNQTYRIECGDSTKNCYQITIQNPKNNINEFIPLTDEEKRIISNYKYFYEKIENEISKFSNSSDKIEYLQKLREKIGDLIVIEIKIHNEEDAYEIFETTNARGIDLSVADLLKNLIFKKIRPDEGRDTAKEMWDELVANIQETKVDLKKFIRYYWLSKESLVTEKKLFREIKSKVVNWQSFTDDIHTNSDWFHKLLEGGPDIWNDILYIKNPEKIYKSISAIRTMGVLQCNVFFLSLFRNYRNLQTNPQKIIKFIENFTFVYSAICKQPGNKLERLYSKYAKLIENIVMSEIHEKDKSKNIQSAFEGIKKDLIQLWPSKEYFLDKFNDVYYFNSEKSRHLIKYILSNINKLYETGEHNIDFTNVNIEHLLPRTPNREWGLRKDEIKTYVNKIGNLTLLHKRLNSVVGNKIISKKIDAFKDSRIGITEKLVHQLEKNGYQWNQTLINERQRELAEIAYDNVWCH